ncbi:hypothetical protein LCGC14_1315670 [marine sediment metagenome]|uniref:Uncharacterized protein n=1 Tax=marine sediment metagenome TaxID=412755 RepID=A0A0F9N1Y1_9ZZZZ
MKEVIIRFRYEEAKELKNDQYYKDLAFNEIYNSSDVLQSEHFEIKNIN